MDFFVIYGLTIISLIITLVAQGFVSGSYRRYKKISNSRGMNGCNAAKEILYKSGLSDVKVEEVSGVLADHYDPRDKTVRLSTDVYHGTSIASISVAAHEVGHAIQDKEGYFFMRLRASLVPVVNFSSYAGYFSILIGFMFGALSLVWLGILCEIAILGFQLVTLPVELNASKRALKLLKDAQIFNNDELFGAKKVLNAAALTYVAGLVVSILNLLRLLLVIIDRKD